MNTQAKALSLSLHYIDGAHIEPRRESIQTTKYHTSNRWLTTGIHDKK